MKMGILSIAELFGGEVTIIKEQLPVKIQLETQIEQDGQVETFKFDEEGALVDLGAKKYLRYKETKEQLKVPVTFSIAETGEVFLTRQGQTHLRLPFAKQKVLPTHYQTEYGLMKLDVKTTLLETAISFENAEGKINVDYELYAGNQLLGKYQIRLQFSA
jgi:uncharacterized beta-barrel protein YwiB (DUF1934 family)